MVEATGKANGQFRTGVVMDPISGIATYKDSTFAMLLEAQRRGHEIWYMEPGDLVVRDGEGLGRMRPLSVRDNREDWFTLGEAEVRGLATLDFLLMRKDPPFDMDYVYTTYVLDLAERAGVTVVNRPNALRDANEKCFTTQFAQCCVPMLITRCSEEIRAFVAEHGLSGKTLVTISCGANVNFDRLRHIAERAAVGDQAEMLLAAEIPEEPGSFRRFCEVVGRRGITEFNYRYADSDRAHVFVGVELAHGQAERDELLQRLTAKGYQVTDMTDNEMAKNHVRYMVGSRFPVSDEVLFRFQFPERPGALLNFLSRVGKRWNISLFHYRNHGAAYGRVLIGIQLPDEDKRDFTSQMDKLGYRYWEETDNPAYHFFAAPNKT